MLMMIGFMLYSSRVTASVPRRIGKVEATGKPYVLPPSFRHTVLPWVFFRTLWKFTQSRLRALAELLAQEGSLLRLGGGIDDRSISAGLDGPKHE